MADFKHGDPVKINRPNKLYHGHLARYTEPCGEGFAYVAFNREGGDHLPAEKDLRNQILCPRKLFPLTQITRFEL